MTTASRTSSISVRAASHGPLRDVDMELPLGRLICFTGPCGSGARTMALDVLYAESRRRYMLALSPLERANVGGLSRVLVDEIDGLPPAIYFGQGNREPGCLAEFLELDGPLSRLWHQHGQYSCPDCGGRCRSFTDEEAADAVTSELAGERCLILAPMEKPREVEMRALVDEIRRAGFLRVRQNGETIRLEDGLSLDPDADFEVVIDRVVPGPATRNRLIEGVRNARKIAAGRTLFFAADSHTRLAANRSLSCDTCGRAYAAVTPEQLALGRSHGPLAGGVMVLGMAARVLGSVTVGELGDFCARLDVDASLLGGINRTVGHAAALSLGHLRLAAGLETLSTGEYQRLLVARCLTSGLSGLLYVFCAPTTGMAQEVALLADGLEQIVGLGNTVIAIDHTESLLSRADQVHAFDTGVIEPSTATAASAGSFAELRKAIPDPPEDFLQIAIVNHPVLEPNTTRIPLHRFVAVTGFSGAGKTRLLQDVIAPGMGTAGGGGGRQGNGDRGESACTLVGGSRIRRVVDLTAPWCGSETSRSVRTLAAELDAFKPLAQLLAATPAARNRNYPAEWFSLDTPGGRCAACEGRGTLNYDLEFLEDLSLKCSTCDGKRYQEEVLEITYRGFNVSDMLDLTVSQAHEAYSREPALRSKFAAAEISGLGDCILGTTLRELEPDQYLWLSLATALVRVAPTDLLLLDEPAAGSHPRDVAVLIGVLGRMVSKGATVVVAGQSPWLVEVSDWHLQLGGNDLKGGGEITYSGPPRGSI